MRAAAAILMLFVVAQAIGQTVDPGRRRQMQEELRRVTESKVTEMHRILRSRQSNGRQAALRTTRVRVVASSEGLCAFNASVSNDQISIPLTTCNVLVQSAFCRASDHLNKTELSGEYYRRLFMAGANGRSVHDADLEEYLDFIRNEDYSSVLSQTTWASYEASMLWVLAHEQSHVYRGHKGYDRITNARSRDQELQADTDAWIALVDLDKTGERAFAALSPLAVFFARSALEDLSAGRIRRDGTHPHPIDRLAIAIRTIEAYRQRDGSESDKEMSRSVRDFGEKFARLIRQYEKIVQEDGS